MKKTKKIGLALKRKVEVVGGLRVSYYSLSTPPSIRDKLMAFTGNINKLGNHFKNFIVPLF